MSFLEHVDFLDPGPAERDLPVRGSGDRGADRGAGVVFGAGDLSGGRERKREVDLSEGNRVRGWSARYWFRQSGFDPTLVYGRLLAEAIKLRWRLRHPHRGYFFRAEDFFGFTKRMDRLKADLLAEAEEMRSDRARSEFARNLGAGALSGQAKAIDARYGASGLDARSHGEQFLDLFSARCRPGGIYLLDEPEAPLSPARQLTFLSMLKALAQEGSQFIVATHSPMLLALPGSAILSFDSGEIRPAEYETLEHVQIMRTFLEDPDAYLRHL